MKVDFSTILLGMDGVAPILDKDFATEALRQFALADANMTVGILRDELAIAFGSAAQPTRLGMVACNALLSSHHKDDTNLSGEQKCKRFELAVTTRKCEVTEMKAEDITEIKKAIARYSPVLVVGRAFAAIEAGAA